MYLMPLFVKKKKLKINIFLLNTVTKQQLSYTHTSLVHLFIINSSISLYYFKNCKYFCFSINTFISYS